jgi:hypothetical protein
MSLRHPELFKGSVLLAPALMPSIQHSNKIQMFISFLKILGFLLPNNTKLAMVEPDKIAVIQQSFKIFAMIHFFNKIE